MRNLHLTSAVAIEFASRIIKQTDSLLKTDEINHIDIACFGTREHPKSQSFGDHKTVHRMVRINPNKAKSLFSKIINVFRFSWNSIAFARANNIDIINAHSVSLLPTGALIKWFCGAKLVYDPHELETETTEKRGLSKLIAKIIERGLIPFVDMTIVVGEGIEDWYRDKYRSRL